MKVKTFYDVDIGKRFVGTLSFTCLILSVFARELILKMISGNITVFVAKGFLRLASGKLDARFYVIS